MAKRILGDGELKRRYGDIFHFKERAEGEDEGAARRNNPRLLRTGDGPVLEVVLDFLDRILGSGFHAPVATDVMRWKYSQPESLAMFETVNTPGNRIVIAGDALAGGRIEDAYESGLLASKHIREIA